MASVTQEDLIADFAAPARPGDDHGHAVEVGLHELIGVERDPAVKQTGDHSG